MEDIYKIAELIRKFRTRTLSEEESRELWTWVKTGDHQEIFDRLLNRKHETEFLNRLKRYDAKFAYRRFVGRIHRPARRFRFYIRVAALFLLPLVSGILLYWWSNGSRVSEQPRMQPMVITPGSQRAVLTLADGKQMPLGLPAKKEVIRDADVIFEYDSLGLNYQQKKAGVTGKKNEVYVPRKGEFSLVLSDGTKVYLNSDSRLIYPLVFGSDQREVSLQGEAYFDVVRDTTRPFLVKTADMTVRVLGTAFNVKSYADEEWTETTLVRGKVRIEENDRNTELSPGEQAHYDRVSGTIVKNKVDPCLYTSWKDGLFIFKRQRLEDLFMILSRWYDVEVFFERQVLKDKLFTGDLRKYENIDVCLHMLELTNEVKFEIKGNAILVK